MMRRKPTEDTTMKKTLILAMLLCLLSPCAMALTMTGLETDTVERNWEGHAFFERMQALTGVAVSAHGETDRAAYAKMLAEMESGAIPADALFKAALSREQEYRLLESGAIVDLAPYIDKYAPNLKAYIEANPSYKALVTNAEGAIYGLCKETPIFADLIGYRVDHFKAAGIDPESVVTMDDFTNAMRALKFRG